MSDAGYQIYKGESNEIASQETPERGQDGTRLHMENFLAACRSRKMSDLHDPITNAYLSASLCHLANISYRVGRSLKVEAGPKFTGDAEATKMAWGAVKVSSARGAAPLVGATEKVVFADNALRGSGKP